MKTHQMQHPKQESNASARLRQVRAELRRALDQLESQRQKLLALHDLGENLADADDEQSVLELAAHAPLELVEARASTVITFDERHDRLKLDMAWGLSDRYLNALRAQMEAGIPAGRCRNCAVLKSQAKSNCVLFSGLQNQAKEEGLSSLICLPIAHEHERVGIIAAYFPSANGPPEDQLHLLNFLGGAIAGALQSLRMRARQVSTLHALDRATESTRELDDLAAEMLNVTAAGWQASAAGLFLYDEPAQSWSIRAHFGLGDDLSDPRMIFALDLSRQTRSTRSPYILPEGVPSSATGLVSAAAAPLATEGEPFGAIVLASPHRRAFTEDHVELLMTMAHQIALAISNARLYQQVNALAVHEERYRLSREMHDGLAQTLAFLGLQAERTEHLVVDGRNETAAQELAEMRQSIRAAYIDVREAIDGLRLSVRDPGAISARLQEYGAEFARQTGLEVRVSSQPDPLTIDPAVGMQLLRIAQEALTNVRKHAQARRVDMLLEQTKAELQFTLADDGRGFPAPGPGAQEHHSYGLATMRERAASVHGSLTIATGPAQGTRLTVIIPANRIKHG